MSEQLKKTNWRLQLARVVYTVYVIAICIFIYKWANDDFSHRQPTDYEIKHPYIQPPAGYNKTVLLVIYRDGITDTLNLQVSPDDYTFELKDGNLCYWRKLNAYGSHRVDIGSYVKTYKVLSSEFVPFK